jgi:hypothetical protein
VLTLPATQEELLRAYVRDVALEVVNGALEPSRALELVHRQVLTPLLHPEDLMAWCYLWEGLEPGTFASLDDEGIARATLDLARTTLGSEQSV